MWTVKFHMFKLDLEKTEEPGIKLPTSTGSLKKQESSRKTSTSALLTMPKPLTVWITTNCGNSERDGNTRPPDLPLEKSVCRSRSNSENRTWKNRLVQNWERSIIKVVYCHLADWTSMQSTSCEMLGWMKHKLKSRMPGEISLTSDRQMTPHLWHKEKTN